MFLSMEFLENKAKICTMREVIILPLTTTVVTGMANQNIFEIFLVLLWSQLLGIRAYSQCQVLWGTRTRKR